MTWNIHGAFGRNPRFDLTRVVELILRADPDIVALQEVDSRHVPDGNAFTLLQSSSATTASAPRPSSPRTANMDSC